MDVLLFFFQNENNPFKENDWYFYLMVMMSHFHNDQFYFEIVQLHKIACYSSDFISYSHRKEAKLLRLQPTSKLLHLPGNSLS